MTRLGIELVTDERDLIRIRKLTTIFSEEDLAMELAKSHMHYIVCHPHQGTDGLDRVEREDALSDVTKTFILAHWISVPRRVLLPGLDSR